MNKDQDQKTERMFEEIEKTIPKKRTPISFQELESTIRRWLLIKDKGLIKIVSAAVIANKLRGDPVWLFLVTASGGVKTEMIRALNKITGIYPISDLTPQTFLSGEKSNKNASLLLRIAPDTILTYKDFTTVLTMHQDKKHAILSQLREIYDGYYKKDFGTGETKEWSGKLGFIAGVTSVIDTHYSVYQALGERFVQYRLTQPEDIVLARRAMANTSKEKEMREELSEAFVNFIHGVQVPEENYNVPEPLQDRIAHLSAFCVRARSSVIRNGYSREIDLIPEPEVPTRFPKQLMTLSTALSCISGGFIEEDYTLIYKTGIDSIPKKRKLALQALLAAGDYIATEKVSEMINYPTNSTRMALEEMEGLRIINVQKGGNAHKWIMNEKMQDHLEKAKPNDADEDILTVVLKGLPEKSDDLADEITNILEKSSEDTMREL